MLKRLGLVLALLALLLASSLQLVYSKHQSRRLFADIEQLKLDHWRLQTEHEQLKLRQSELAALPLIDHIASNELKMVFPKPAEVKYLRR